MSELQTTPAGVGVATVSQLSLRSHSWPFVTDPSEQITPEVVLKTQLLHGQEGRWPVRLSQ